LGRLRRLPPRRVAGPELGGDEEVASRESLGFERLLDSRADARFVLIPFRGVDVPVAGANGLADRGGGVIVSDEVRAAAKVRELDVCGQWSALRSLLVGARHATTIPTACSRCLPVSPDCLPNPTPAWRMCAIPSRADLGCCGRQKRALGRTRRSGLP